jgi:hypothetical protein
VFIRSVSLVALYDRLCPLVWSVLGRSFHSDTCLTPTIQRNLRFFLLGKKTRVFERACIVAKKGAICPIFEGDMPPKKIYPQKWPLYDGHSMKAV